MIKVSIELSEQETKDVEDFLYEIAPSPWIIIQNQITKNSILEGFFETQEKLDSYLSKLDNSSREILKVNGKYNLENLEDCVWEEAYKIHFEPWQYQGFHWVPSWCMEDYECNGDELCLSIDPGMAFGTGQHETTRMCLEELVDISKLDRKKSLLDLGCGSGIIAITAALLGYDHIVAIDNDPDATRISKDNAIKNKVHCIEFINTSLEELNAIGQFDIIFANIQADILINYSEIICSFMKNEGTLVLSGILKTELEKVNEYYSQQILKTPRLEKLSVTSKFLNEWGLIKIS